MFFRISLICVVMGLFGFSSCMINKSEELLKIFPDQIGVQARYVGMAEYAHKVEITNITKDKNKTIYNINGYMINGISDEIEKRQFKIEYIIDQNRIVEKIINNDEYRKEGYDNKLNSLVPNQIILKTPLRVNHSWEQELVINNNSYVVKTTIVEINLLNDGKKQYKTKLEIDNIEGYFNNKYMEERVYEEGKGLVSFSNTMAIYKIDIDRDLIEEDFLFGYAQAEITYK